MSLSRFIWNALYAVQIFQVEHARYNAYSPPLMQFSYFFQFIFDDLAGLAFVPGFRMGQSLSSIKAGFARAGFISPKKGNGLNPRR